MSDNDIPAQGDNKNDKPEAENEQAEAQSQSEAKPQEKPQAESQAGNTAAPGKFDFNVMIYELWNAKLPLMKVFWLYYFSVMLVLTALGNVLVPMAAMFAMIKIVWAGFMVKPIWLAADKYKGPDYWALAAKAAAVLIGIAVVMSILF